MEFKWADAGVNKESVENHVSELSGFREKLLNLTKEGKYTSPKSFVNLVSDSKILEDVEKAVNEKKNNALKYVILVGIGGSGLGTKAVYDALEGFYQTVSEPTTRMVFLDTINPEFLEKVDKLIDSEINLPQEMAVVVVSKSGQTAETLSNTEYLFSLLEKKFKKEEVSDRTIFITESRSPLDEFAGERGILTLYIPAEIGGRYSVFSAVGILPLLLAGMDIEGLLNGALAGREMCLRGRMDNPALVSASVVFELIQNHKRVNNHFFFAPQLESVGKWWRQLTAESLGKRQNREGEDVHTGIDPMVSLGSVDLHSMFQLFMGGPRDKITTFIWCRERAQFYLPQNSYFEESSQLGGITPDKAQKVLLEATKQAYREEKMPFMEAVLPEISEYALGEFMQFKMMEVMYLAELLNINAFDQPEVEKYKSKVREVL